MCSFFKAHKQRSKSLSYTQKFSQLLEFIELDFLTVGKKFSGQRKSRIDTGTIRTIKDDFSLQSKNSSTKPWSQIDAGQRPAGLLHHYPKQIDFMQGINCSMLEWRNILNRRNKDLFASCKKRINPRQIVNSLHSNIAITFFLIFAKPSVSWYSA